MRDTTAPTGSAARSSLAFARADSPALRPANDSSIWTKYSSFGSMKQVSAGLAIPLSRLPSPCSGKRCRLRIEREREANASAARPGIRELQETRAYDGGI